MVARKFSNTYILWIFLTCYVYERCKHRVNSYYVTLLFADQTAAKKMRRYINAAAPVIEYIDKLYISRHISLDW